MRFRFRFVSAIAVLIGAGYTACTGFAENPQALVDAGFDSSISDSSDSPVSDSSISDSSPPVLEAAADDGGERCLHCRTRHCDDAGACDPLVFVTAETYLGDMGGIGAGGLARADAICQAAAAGSGTFRAWLSDTKIAALTRITDGGTSRRPLRLGDGKTIVAASVQEILQTGAQQPINRSATGAVVLDASADASPIWTATHGTGAKYTITTAHTCGEWSTALPSNGGVVGSVSTGVSWTEYGAQNCNVPAHLYCFEIVP